MSPREQDAMELPASPSKSFETCGEDEESPILRLTRHLVKSNGSIVGTEVARTILPTYQTFASAIPTSNSHRPALISIDGREPISHARIAEFILHDFGPALHRLGFGRGHRVAVVLPNGPELALALLATAHWASCVPLSANGAASELEADILRCGADLIIGPYCGPVTKSSTRDAAATADAARFKVLDNDQNWTVFTSIEESAKRLGVPYCGLLPSSQQAGLFKLVPKRSILPIAYDQDLPLTPIRPVSTIDTNCNDMDNEILVLFTSGTTGNKKLVPHRLGDMLTAATTIALSWALSPQDVSCCSMPLFHVGGIVRQVFAPIVSNGAVICCPSFDPSMFWALLSKRAFTWYYAAPTMHQVILQTHEAEVCPEPSLRMIANAAGGLLPSLAIQLRDKFGANVLPSYGMTECMPISSPPADYQLTKPGTSGVPVGPEVAIINTATMKYFPPGEEGPICVRGEPCFRGYGKIANDANPVENSFLAGGWFNTGDLGYMDEDGYLYITGRSKEVINRGGEIISPMEVEEAVQSHPDIKACAAFSTPHDILQEVVGIVVVMESGRPRIDLAHLHEYLGERLAAPKWPQCLVFLDGLPKSHTNKLLRVKLGSRLALPELNDNMSHIERTFEGTCPPQGTGLDIPIPVSRVTTSPDLVQALLRKAVDVDKKQRLLVRPHPKRVGCLICYVYQIDRVQVITVAREVLDRYAVPTHIVELADAPASGNVTLPLPEASDSIAAILQETSSSGPADALAQSVQEMFVDLLKLDYVPSPGANFFHLGGSSMLASQLASRIRKQFGIPCSGAEIFHHTSCDDLSRMIRQRSCDDASATSSDMTGSQEDSNKSVMDHGAPFPGTRMPPNNNFGAALFQLIPMFVVFPVWQISRYLFFFAVLLRSLDVVPGERDIGRFVIAYLAFHLCWVTITPLLFVAIKWIVIGRYKAGRYPLWSSYYLRWWFVDQCRKLFLRGVYGSNEVLLNFYYRLLGAKIGENARISLECEVAEYDLVNVGSEAAVEIGTLRGFGVDNGAMILGPVSVGYKASVGARSVVAPYTSVHDYCHLSPVTSSYESGKALDPKHSRVNRKCLPEPSLWMLLCFEGPITFFVNCIAQIPPLAVLFWMLQFKYEADEEFDTPSDLMEWLCDPRRIPFYIGIRLARALLSPFFYMAAAVLVKKTVIGQFKAGPRNVNSQWQLFRHHLSSTLFSRKKIQLVADIVGRHYELVSCLYRLLGAKVGKRVFWPGHQPIFSGEFDLLEIGDDVVFGSRSAIFCTTIDSCKKVTLCAGANVADNCVVLPGSTLAKNAVLGSNSLCPEDWYLPESSVWLGARGGEPTCLERGTETFAKYPILSDSIDRRKLQLVGDLSTLRPFGKAFYMRQASYFVWPLPLIIFFSVVVKALITVFHTLPLLASLQGAAAILYGVRPSDRDHVHVQYPFKAVYWTVLFCFFFANIARVFVWLFVELCAKWLLMGKRQVGRYNYDTSSYPQRWELYQLIAKTRKFSRFNFLQFFFGTPYMTWYFRWNGGSIGEDCCLYPSGADPFMPEPDLVKMGDRCVVDCASIVCHLNTRGNFELQEIVMENDCTLRTRSRIQQGVYMERGSQLLEKSLALTGEIIESHSVWQGGPASWWFKYSDKSIPYASEEIADETTSLLKSDSASTYSV